MKKLEISTEDLLKNWDKKDLISAKNYAFAKTLNLNPTTKEYQMWLSRQLAYAAELNRRAN